MSALSLDGVAKSYGRTQILQDVTLDIRHGESHAIIGPNGAGKSTLFNLITGLTPVSAGDIRLDGRSVRGVAPHRIARRGLSRSFQITNIFPRLSVFENIRCALLWSRGHGLSIWRLLHRVHDLTAEVDALVDEIGLGPRRDLPAGVLSYAEQRALEIGITLGCGAGVVLLDEPTAGMSNPETAASVALIRKLSAGKTLVIVEHDMKVVFELADRISVLADGRVLATGRPDEIRANPRVQAAYLGTSPEGMT